LTERDQAAVLREVRGCGRAEIDEPAQELLWRLESSGRTRGLIELRQPVGFLAAQRVDSILALEEGRSRVAYVLATRAEAAGRVVWEPVAAFLRGPGGGRSGLTLQAFDFGPAAPQAKKGAARKAFALAARRWQDARGATGAGAAGADRGAAAACCDDLREVVVELTATGRAALSPDQDVRRDRIAGRCEALALATLAGAARRIGARPAPGDLLRAHHLADRAAAITAGGSLPTA
jgi:hypothetical protein